MRIKLSIEHKPNEKLIINYQYLISSWLYSLLYSRDSESATWLHDRGYEYKGASYKHFCFSMLKPKLFKLHPKEGVLELVEGPTELIISFNAHKIANDVINELLKMNTIKLLSDSIVSFEGTINNIEVLQAPVFTDNMNFIAKTPICISVGDMNSKQPKFLSPEDDNYPEAFARNLVNKANAYFGEEKYRVEQVKFSLLSSNNKSKLFSIKGIKVRGYLYRFNLSAPKELIEIGYYAGFGTQNGSLGMGFCEEEGN